MGMVSMHLFLAMAIFTVAYKTTTGISTRGCTSNIDILKKELVARQLESYFRNEKDIIEIQVKTNTCIALTNDGNTISNKTFASASPIEKYNMFIYFIVTETGRALMQYPADTDTMALRVLGSPKVMMDVDVMLDNHDCALNTEQFRNIFLQTISKLAPITNNDDISVCYYEVSEKDLKFTWELLFLPYYTYNNFKTFCSTGGVVTEVPQALPNILLRWLCIILHLTLPIGLFFIPHTMHNKTDSYRKCDIPFSVSMLLSYITYWTPDGSCCCCCSKNDNKEVKKGNVNGEHSHRQQPGSEQIEGRENGDDNGKESVNNSCNPLFRLFIIIALVSCILGVVIHCCLRHRNVLENDLLVLTGSSAFYHLHALAKIISLTSDLKIVLLVYVTFVCCVLLCVVGFYVLIIKGCGCFISQPEDNTTDKISYPIYLLLFRRKEQTEGDPCCCTTQRNCCVCYDQSKVVLVTEHADLNATIKLVSEVIFSTTFWYELFKKVCFCAIFYAPLVIIFCIPYVNNCIVSAVNCCERNNWNILRCFLISLLHVVKLAFTIVIVNMTLIQTTTLILQLIVLTLFVGIPVYPKLLHMIILLTGFIKYTMQAILKFQSRSKYVLDQMFKKNRYKDKHEIPKKDFDIVLEQCTSVNILVVFMKIVALMFVWYSAYVAITQGPKGLSAWKDVIPSVILFVAPDWLSKFIYNEAAEYQYIDQCVKTAMEKLEFERNTTAWLCSDCENKGKDNLNTPKQSIPLRELVKRTTFTNNKVPRRWSV